MGLIAIDEFGKELDERWRALDYGPRLFSELCVTGLAAAQLHRSTSPGEIVEWALRGNLPKQFNPQATFGQPPVTLYRNSRFVVEALFWIDGTTTIHDHAFSGAFQVLAGSSIETKFVFTGLREIDGHIRFGRLKVQETSLLAAGALRPILPGPKYIHSLFHLERPSVSLLVRTFWEPSPGIQMQYYPCGLGFDPFVEDEGRDRMLQIVGMLRNTEHPSFERTVGDLIAASDLDTAFRIIRECATIPDRGLLDNLVTQVRDPQAVKLYAEWLAQERRLKFLRSRRSLVRDPALRFFLAVLLNCQRRADALKLVASCHSGNDPALQIASWLRELSTTAIRLQSGGEPWESNVLNLPAFEPGFDEALAAELGGRSRPRKAEEEAFIKRLAALPPLAPLFFNPSSEDGLA